ncbi:DMT family transporter [Granulosicoccus sp. 3-233]|uniref:DMT family transporter n=1 Tax=Granulosicoccus sp. 3-233 TaxID=3417969 RepID=UPI003D32C2BA
MEHKRTTGIILILAAAMLWGTTGTAQTFAPLGLSSYWVGTGRLVVAGIFFLILLTVRDINCLRWSRLQPLPWAAIAWGAAGMAVYNLAFFAGVRATGVAVGTAVALGSGPLWAGLLQALITRQKPRGIWWVAVSIAVVGLVLTTFNPDEDASLSVTGLILCLLSGLSYACYALATKHIVAHSTPAVGTATVFTLAALLALPFAFLLAGQPQLHVADLGVMVWLGVVATGVAYLLFSSGLRHVSSATGVALALAEPVTAVALAILIVGERPGMTGLLGVGLILGGLALLIRSELLTVRN